MKFDRVKIFEQSKELIVKHKLIFVEDVIALLPCSKPTFYSFYPDNSDELDILRALIDENKISLKVAMRKKWFISDAPALQMGLMKLICTPEERKILSLQYNENDNNNTNTTTIINLGSGVDPNEVTT